MFNLVNKTRPEQDPSPLNAAVRGAQAARLANPVSGSVFAAALTLAVLVGITGSSAGWPDVATGSVVIVITLVGLYVLFALKIANQWEKAVVLRFGRWRFADLCVIS